MMRPRTSFTRRSQTTEGQTPTPQRSTRKRGSGRGRGAAAEASATFEEKIVQSQPPSAVAPSPVEVRSKRRSSPGHGEHRRSKAEPAKAKKSVPQDTESATLTLKVQKDDPQAPAAVSNEEAVVSPRCSEDATPTSAEVIATLSADEISQRLSSLREMLVQEGNTAGIPLEDCLAVAVDLGFELVERNKKRELEINRLAHDVDELRQNMEALPVVQTSSPPASEHLASLKTAVMEEAQQECLRLGSQNFIHLMSDTMEFLHTMIDRADVAESTARMLLSMLEAEKPPAEEPPADKPSKQSPSWSSVPDSKPSSFSAPSGESVSKYTLATSLHDVQLGLVDTIGRSRVSKKNETCKQAVLSGFAPKVPLEAQTQTACSSKGLDTVPPPQVVGSPIQSIRRSLVSAPGSLSPTFLTPAASPMLSLPFGYSPVPVASASGMMQVSPPPVCARGFSPSRPIEQAPAKTAFLASSSFQYAPYLQPANMGTSSSPPIVVRSLQNSRPSSQDPPMRYRTVSPRRRSEQGQPILQTPPQERILARWSSCGVPANAIRSSIINFGPAPVTGPSSPSTSTRYESRAVTPSAGASQRATLSSQLFEKLDTNHDGVITREEWQAALAL